jgi:hypothetical protein
MFPSKRRELEMTDLSSKSKMGALPSRRWRLKLGVAAALATMALVTPSALARPAGAGAGAGLSQVTADTVLHRDGSKAVAFQAYPAASESSHQVVLHRDGSKADPFVADLAPTGTQTADGFDWGDAAVGLGAGMIVGVLGLAAIAGYGGRRAQTA